MSGVAVVLRRDGAPATSEAVRLVLDCMKHRGPDGEAVVTNGPAGLGHQHFWVTPEEKAERQPLSDHTGRLWIACDGRIDNRDELLPALDVPLPDTRSTSDAAVLLLAYARWGVPGFARVVGSFAAAIWDSAEHRLTLVRDALGDRTMCYALTPDAVVAASEEHAVLAHPGVDRALDERRVAQFLALAELDSDATFFAAVKEVLPGHALVVEPERVSLVRYWEADTAQRLRLADDREYAEAFAERLRVAVRAQTRSATPVALMLSGGLDSSAVAATAAGMVPPLKAVSWVFDELPSCDERRWIDPVVQHCGLEPLQFAGDGDWPFRDFDLWRHNPSSPEDDLYRRLVERARGMARDAGCRVVLSGMFGDHLYSGAHGWFWERLSRGRPGSALNGAWRTLRQPGGGARLRAALLPRRMPEIIRKLRRTVQRPRPWLTARAAGHAESTRRWPDSADAALRPAQCRAVLGLLAAHGVSGETFHTASAGVEIRHPFRDRRLVELMLRLPSEQLDRPGTTRPVLREAMLGMLPETARMRVGKGSLAALFERGFAERERHEVGRRLATSRSVWEGMVRPDWVSRVVTERHPGEVDRMVLSHCAFLGQWVDRCR